jgi:hypothetical protein
VRRLCSAILVVAGLVPWSGLAGQSELGFSPSSAEATRMVTVTAGEQYAAGRLHRALFGDHYRDLWTTPIQVPPLDLDTYAGGLTPVETGGGQQTQSLKLKSAGGRDYVFRSVDKDPTPALPRAYRGTVVHRLVQDAISAAHPGGPLIAVGLLDAIGVLQVKPRLFLLPDQVKLGRFSPQFANMLGYLEERPDDGFAGADKVLDWEEVVELLDQDPSHQVDIREFLKARLVDHLLGDWDRHGDQWSWAGIKHDGRTRWRPIPRDRDQALARYDGLLLGLARRVNPKLVNFGPRYPSILGLAWNAQELDRRLLASLDREAFDSIAISVQAAITDSVIDGALEAVPEPWQARHPWIARALRQRRDSLVGYAGEFYRLLAEDVDIVGTDAAELAEARREASGRLTLVVTRVKSGDTTFRRSFEPRETKTVRLLLSGGVDSLRLLGQSGAGPLLEIEREPGVDGLIVFPGVRKYRLHDPAPDSSGVKTDSTASEPRPRDWGSSFGISPRAEYEADLGLLLGMQASRTDFARRLPYGSRIRLVTQYATAANGLRTELIADLRRVNPQVRLELRVRASEIEVVRFTGFGNETPAPRGSTFQNVDQWQFVVAPLLEYAVSDRLLLQAGPLVKYSTTDLHQDRLIDRDRPVGSTGFGRVGAQGGIAVGVLDSTDLSAAGGKLTVGGSVFPPIWSGSGTFGEIHAEAVGRLPVRVGPNPLIAARLGAKRVWGAFPYDEAAFLGGQRTLRGYDYQRFAGDASLFGSLEVRVPVARVLEHWVPTRIGVFALGDAGRVWADDTRSRRVHAAGGGGVWLSLFEDSYTGSLAMASGSEGTLWYLRSGLAF